MSKACAKFFVCKTVIFQMNGMKMGKFCFYALLVHACRLNADRTGTIPDWLTYEANLNIFHKHFFLMRRTFISQTILHI
jgi:hypothetical protein